MLEFNFHNQYTISYTIQLSDYKHIEIINQYYEYYYLY
jgi:hypothetical protein